jgi:hypothetical protein
MARSRVCEQRRSGSNQTLAPLQRTFRHMYLDAHQVHRLKNYVKLAKNCMVLVDRMTIYHQNDDNHRQLPLLFHEKPMTIAVFNFFTEYL